MLFTVFTPTFNRAYSLRRLYESLKRQSVSDFEWLIVDDGSCDNTRALVEEFISENVLNINYVYQTNGGKHRALNNGVLHAKGELFFNVDSDDYLLEDSLQNISEYYNQIKHDNHFAGVCGLRCFENGEPVGGYLTQEFHDWSPLNRPYQGDMAEVFKTDVVRRYPFPDIKGENFCPEGIVLNKIGSDYLLRYFNRKIYICAYLSDGLTKAAIQNRIRCPRYATESSRESLFMNIPIKRKIKESINFWRFYLYIQDKKFPKIPMYSWFMFPFGIAMILRDKVILNKDNHRQKKEGKNFPTNFIHS